MKIEALQPLHIRRAAGDLHLRPGVPIELPDEEATRLLKKVPDKVRVATTIESAVKPDGCPLSAIFWETGDGRILGSAVPEFLAREGDTFWVVTTFEEQVRWIHADQLRSRKQFERQRPLQEAEPIQEPFDTQRKGGPR